MPLLEERHLGSALDVHATFSLEILLEKITPPTAQRPENESGAQGSSVT